MPTHDDTAQSSDGQPPDQSDYLTEHEALLRVSALRYAEDVLTFEDVDGPEYRFDTYTRALKHLDRRDPIDEPVFAEGSA